MGGVIADGGTETVAATGTGAVGVTSTSDGAASGGGDTGAGTGTGSPRIIVESSAGHTVEVTYQDLMLILIAATFAASVAGWFS